MQDNVGIENGRVDEFNTDQIVALRLGSNLLKSKQHASASYLSTDDG